MADAVTYADLRFAEDPQWPIKPPETSPERDSDYMDDTYENIVKPPREKQDLQAPPRGGWHKTMAGFGHWAPHLALLFLLLFLLLSAITIERTMKHLHVSSELQALNDSKEMMVGALRRDLQDSQERVRRLTEGTEKISSALQKTEEELQIQRTIKNKTQEELKSAEEALGEVRSKLNQWERDICPRDWILFGKKCLRVTNEVKKWAECDEFCKNMEGNLIVVQKNDLRLQAFLSNQNGDFWIGKELRWEYKPYKCSWEWPNQYRQETGKCWQIRNGNLMPEECWEKKKCICERNLVLVTLKKYYSDYSPYINLWDASYHCWKKYETR
ncbi:C-type lectin domain family 1 member A-like [Hyla sarda]|uniref:C-type lectin domain family 1 member A-like n=1 Tax=Hyla sarda TaxID=327740 RepID=UPI0024C3820A|nr:C-type lectin domain family 1 member A-like [Hyla sarda]